MSKACLKSFSLFIFFVSFSFFSCSNMDTDAVIENSQSLTLIEKSTSQNSCSISGSYSFPKGALPLEIMNMLNKGESQTKSQEEESIIAKALKSTASQFIPVQEELPCVVITISNGSHTYSSLDYDSIITVNEKELSFSASNLPNGTWTATVDFYNSSDKNRSVPLMEGVSSAFEIKSRSLAIQIPCVELSPKTQKGIGTCSLNFTCSDENANEAKVEWRLASKDKNQKRQKLGEQIFRDLKNAAFTFGGQSVAAGVYEASFSFYKEILGEKYLIFQCMQQINVFEGMQTNFWQAGESAPCVSSDGTFNVGKKRIDEFTKTIFYVSQNGNDNVDLKENKLSPLASVQKAVDAIIEQNDGKSTYRIFISGNVSGSPGKNKALASIDPEKDLKLSIEKRPNSEIDAVLDAKSLGRVIYIGKNANVSLKNIEIRGGNIEKESGAGLFVNGGKLSLLEGTIITENQSSENGGGVCFVSEDANKGSLCILDDATISKNYAKYGGGLYIKCAESSEAEITLAGGILGGSSLEEANIAESLGGGVYISCSAKNKNIIDLAGTKIAYNKANENGGGLYKAGNGLIAYSSSEISNNSCYGEGGGAFVYAGGIILKDSNKGSISFNNARFLGGGVRLESGANLYDSKQQEIKDGKSASLDRIFGNLINTDYFQDIYNPTTLTIRVSEPCSTSSINAKSIQENALQNFTLYLGKSSSQAKNLWPVTSVKIKGKSSIESSSNKKAELKGDASDSVISISGSGDVTLKNLSISGGQAVNGGGICDTCSGTTKIISSSVCNNTASSKGGGIYKAGGSLEIDKDSVIGEKSKSPASAESHSNAVISDEASNDCGGGGVYVSCPNGKIIINGLVSFNYSSTYGGGIYICKGSLESEEDNILMNGAKISDNDIIVQNSK